VTDGLHSIFVVPVPQQDVIHKKTALRRTFL